MDSNCQKTETKNTVTAKIFGQSKFSENRYFRRNRVKDNDNEIMLSSADIFDESEFSGHRLPVHISRIVRLG